MVSGPGSAASLLVKVVVGSPSFKPVGAITFINVLPQYVCVVGRVKQTPEEQEFGEGDTAMTEIRHIKVYPAEDDLGDVNPFSVEILCHNSDSAVKKMPGALPYLIVGAPIVDAGVTIVAENIIDITSEPDAQQRFSAERSGWWDIVQTKVDSIDNKRSANFLNDDTPSKKKCLSA